MVTVEGPDELSTVFLDVKILKRPWPTWRSEIKAFFFLQNNGFDYPLHYP